MIQYTIKRIKTQEQLKEEQKAVNFQVVIDECLQSTNNLKWMSMTTKPFKKLKKILSRKDR